MLEFLASIVFEFILQVVGEILIELGWVTAGAPFEEQKRTHPVFAALGIVLFGAIAGFAISFLWPERLSPYRGMPGVSLIVSPIGAGACMEAFGRWRESNKHPRSYLATYWGGGLFALSMALVRYLWVVGFGAE